MDHTVELLALPFKAVASLMHARGPELVQTIGDEPLFLFIYLFIVTVRDGQRDENISSLPEAQQARYYEYNP